MFNDSKYSRWYSALIERAKIREKPKPAERHHVIPKCVGGKEIVFLTPREHAIAHMLLVKMTNGDLRNKMLWALHRMMHSNSPGQFRYKLNSHLYDLLRKRFNANMSKPKSPAHRQKLKKHLAKLRKDVKLQKQIRAKQKGQKRTLDQCLNISLGTSEGMSDPKVVARMKRSSKKRWSDPKARQKIADQNSRTFKLTHRQTGKATIVKNLAQYCRDHCTHHRKVHQEFVCELLATV